MNSSDSHHGHGRRIRGRRAPVGAGLRPVWLVLVLPLLAACGGPPEPEQPQPPRVPPPADTARAEPAEPRPEEPVGDPVEVPPMPEPEAEPEREREREEAPAVDRPLPARPTSPVRVAAGAILPRERIVAFYGNPASERMGILGALPPDEMLARLDREVRTWREADPRTPVRPALHLIAVMATGDPGRDGLYRLRMPDWRIEQVMEWAERRDALVFLDIQPGRSDVTNELPRLHPWLKRPNVHLALDPEWNMPEGAIPGQRIGRMDAAEVNFAVDFLAELVRQNDLPPKVLVIHRFTEDMLDDADEIRTDPRVQVVINMDGWGPPAMKINSYRDVVAPEATQFTGFKLFYHNDRRDGSRMLEPWEILRLRPIPVYIQYQ